MGLEQDIQQQKFKSEHEKLAVNILYTGNWLASQDARLLKPFGLTPQQFNILRILRGQRPNPATVNLLQERMLDKMSNVSRLVEKLRLKGLLERHTCSADRRAVDVSITEKGMVLLATIDTHSDKWSNLLTNLSTSEARSLNTLLDKLRG